MKLELRGITKRFGAVTANAGINLTIEPGEIHALLGENGAGKSTLMNVLYGLTQPDEGQILIDGEPRTFSGPRAASAAGIGMVHQHFMLVPVLTVAENLMLGREAVRGPFSMLDHRAAADEIAEASARFGLRVDPGATVGDLPVGAQQRVEILKALMGDARVLILDEPTAVLTPQEINDLVRVMTGLRDAGTSVVFITHKLREVRAAADTITVLRDGRVVGRASPRAPEAELAALMVGRSVDLEIDRPPARSGDTVLSLWEVSVPSDRGGLAVSHLSLDVHAGEIVALAGVQGNGQDELAEALVGLRPAVSGTISLREHDIAGWSVRDRHRAGMAYVPEDRSHDGVIAQMTVEENLVLDLHDDETFAKGITLRRRAIADNGRRRVAEFDIRAVSPDTPCGALSGGNQQKVVLARALSRPLEVLVICQPTRGVDVGAQESIYARIVAERDRGTAVVLVSTELDELLGLADRLVVMYRGEVVGELPSGAPRQQVGLMMAGVPADEARRQAATVPDDGVGR
jgi:ABC-type uncharacterized transport system ATPase subunit